VFAVGKEQQLMQAWTAAGYRCQWRLLSHRDFAHAEGSGLCRRGCQRRRPADHKKSPHRATRAFKYGRRCPSVALGLDPRPDLMGHHHFRAAHSPLLTNGPANKILDPCPPLSNLWDLAPRHPRPGRVWWPFAPVTDRLL